VSKFGDQNPFHLLTAEVAGRKMQPISLGTIFWGLRSFDPLLENQCGDSGRKIMRLSCALVCLVSCFALSGSAQVAPPPGWAMQTLSNGVVMTSPGNDPNSHVIMTLMPPGTPVGDVRTWFSNKTASMALSTGRVLGMTEVMEQQGILARVVQIEDQRRARLRIVFYGYPSPRGYSVPVLLIPATVSDQDPRLQAAHQYIHQLAGQHFELSSQPPPMQPMQPGESSGLHQKTDIDLTYHAKAIIPRERDVPLKGVYVFIGFAFGPSYGGVGTTMTWGQRATQQLLLLFANGVAAKTDLKGDNLAGHHQAEGFATMDAGNPAAVSGAPYGQWTEDENAVHIQWNVGAPTDLVKNGNNLEGKGERWTPFHLVEGQRLEGTFVRKMEAGLRSQSIVLHQDGTFIGDGVNVTMGGELVNPNFPARGSGTYEVHKGSMILYFANGFTQAIACILDADQNGEVRTVLLNGFPFERVR